MDCSFYEAVIQGFGLDWNAESGGILIVKDNASLIV